MRTQTKSILLVTLTATSMLACSGGSDAPPSSEPSGTTDAPLAWITPESTDFVPAGDPIELAVMTHDASAQVVRFRLDGEEIFACDPSAEGEDCRLGDTWRVTTTFAAEGHHVLTASFAGPAGETVATRDVEVVPAGTPPPEESSYRVGRENVALPNGVTRAPSLDLGAASDTELGSRGYLDPNRGYHNVFGGVSWAVSNQRVLVHSPPAGSVSAIASCMKRYGGSIRRWADHYSISRGAVMATAITESNCTDPHGSSDGLSSGPMQVTASTCSAITGLSRSTCRVRMYTQPDFSFQVGTRYMASSYQVAQHHHDPPKIGAAYNAGSVRAYYGNRWHMLVTGNHLERWVGAYNAYRSWEGSSTTRALVVGPNARELPVDDLHDGDALARVVPVFDGAHVTSTADLPNAADEGTTVFVGDFARRDGHFFVRAGGTWVATTSSDTE